MFIIHACAFQFCNFGISRFQTTRPAGVLLGSPKGRGLFLTWSTAHVFETGPVYSWLVCLYPIFEKNGAKEINNDTLQTKDCLQKNWLRAYCHIPRIWPPFPHESLFNQETGYQVSWYEPFAYRPGLDFLKNQPVTSGSISPITALKGLVLVALETVQITIFLKCKLVPPMLIMALLPSTFALLFFFFFPNVLSGCSISSYFIFTCYYHLSHNSKPVLALSEIPTTPNTSPSLVESSTSLNFHCSESDGEDHRCSATYSALRSL